jgi:protein TonB
METKKSMSKDLTRMSGLFLSFGFCVSLAIIISAFELKQYDEGIVKLDGRNVNSLDESIKVPVTEIKPPSPPPVKQIVFVETKKMDEAKDPPIVDIDDNNLLPIEIPTQVDPPAEETEEPMVFPEEFATPKEGMAAFYKDIGDRIKYPPQARRMGIEGLVFVEFVIGKDGRFTDVRAVKGIGGGCDEEAVRAIQSAPAWNPGKQRGKPVKQRYTLPVTFKLG